MGEPAKSGVAVAMELFDLAVQMEAQRFRRERPTASDEEVRAHVNEWVMDRPGAPGGDAPGRIRPPDGIQ